MCSVEEDSFDSGLSHLVCIQQKCMKCEEPAVTICRTKDPFCRMCFCTYFRQKFRSLLGKSRKMKPREKVLLGFSGDSNSRVLVNLVEDGLSELSSKKLSIIPSILFIDEGAILNQSLAERCLAISNIFTVAEKSGFPSFFIQLEHIFGSAYQPTNIKDLCDASGILESEKLELILSQNEETLQHRLLIAAFESIISLSAKENLLLTLRRRLFIQVAKWNGYHKIFLGDDANKVSTRFLGSIAQGRGSTIPLDVGYCDDRHGDVSIIRPLREFPKEEILEFVRFNDLSAMDIPGIYCEKNATSIERMTEQFISGLQSNYSSTISTIFRTGEKLGISTSGKDNFVCNLCQAPLVEVDECVFSHVSQGNIGNSICVKKLCYGCRLVAKDVKDTGVLPLSEGIS